MKLYTKTGDDGLTGLFGGERVPKDHPRVVAYGEADGLNAALGLAAVAATDTAMVELLTTLQRSVFVLGADLATPPDAPHQDKTMRIVGDDVSWMEAQIDAVDGSNKPLTGFVVPGGCELAARLHVARDAARRCERSMVTLTHTEPEGVTDAAMQWINRSSDLLFAMARRANAAAGVADTPWPGP